MGGQLEKGAIGGLARPSHSGVTVEGAAVVDCSRSFLSDVELMMWHRKFGRYGNSSRPLEVVHASWNHQG